MLLAHTCTIEIEFHVSHTKCTNEGTVKLQWSEGLPRFRDSISIDLTVTNQWIWIEGPWIEVQVLWVTSTRTRCLFRECLTCQRVASKKWSQAWLKEREWCSLNSPPPMHCSVYRVCGSLVVWVHIYIHFCFDILGLNSYKTLDCVLGNTWNRGPSGV